jgi:alkyl hydroperoxide reductase subunit AhpC
VGISCDSTFAHRAWAEQIGVSFPLLTDYWPHGEIAQRYGILRSIGCAERALFIIDKQGVIRYIDVHQISEQPDEEVLFEELAKLR